MIFLSFECSLGDFNLFFSFFMFRMLFVGGFVFFYGRTGANWGELGRIGANWSELGRTGANWTQLV
jgi:hypothetical protein